MDNYQSPNAQRLKIAIFYDWLNQWGGAERVLLNLLKIYPQAEIFTLVHHPKKTTWLPKNTKIHTSFLQNFPFAKNNFPFYALFYPIILETFDFSNFDIVISTTSTIGYCLITPVKTLHLSYLHNINRHIYLNPPKYLDKLIDIYKKFDQVFINRPEHLICNSLTVQQRIKNIFHKHATIINPGIDLNKFKPSKINKKYFLIVSRLVKHKKIDLAIRVCQKLNLELFIVGEGRDKKYFQSLATSPKIKFLGILSQKKLINIYQNCQALICPQIEDFGLSPLEAQACGKPVIAFNQGGIADTIINNKTGILFSHQTEKFLSMALKKFFTLKFSTQDCRNNAKKYSSKSFMINFKNTVLHLWQQHLDQTITP